MNQRSRLWYALAAAAVLTAGLLGPGFAQAPSSQGGPPAAMGEEQANEAGPSLPVLYITSIEVLRTTLEPHLDIVRAQGLVSSKGWSSPQLVPLFVGKPLDNILDLQFIAAAPTQSQNADGFVPVSATFELAPGNPYKGVRIRAAENAIEVTKIPGSTRVDIKIDDCKDCIGKKFAERGRATAGTQGVVRREDLPKGDAMVRWIAPGGGIRGITHNPNRLNLILGPDNTIIQAFWE